jgi:hypothetical protein
VITEKLLPIESAAFTRSSTVILSTRSLWEFSALMRPSPHAFLICILFPLLLAGCGKKEGYEIREDKVIWHSWRGDGLFGKWSETELTDAGGFKILEQYQPPCPGYAKNARHVYCGTGKLDGADVETFQILDKWSGLAKDAKQVYYHHSAIQGAHAATFELAGTEGLGRDKTDYYLRQTPLRVRDRASFQVLDDKVCGKDHHIWARDKFDYYVDTQATPIAVSSTFQVIQSWYAKDSKQVYFGTTVLAAADPASFQGIGGEEGEFAKDANHVYWQGQVVEDCDAATFHLLDYRFAKDSKRAYFCYQGGIPPLALPDSDGMTFEVIGPSSQGFGYAKDANQVYQGGNVISGADPATFVVDPGDPEKASDKNQRYHYGQPVK